VTDYCVNLDDIRAAHEMIVAKVHRTPVLTCRALNAMAKRELFFKCENFQKVGAFKIRGASHAVARLTDEESSHGVVTHSSGNHAQALALAAAQRGIVAHIVMPESALEVKRRAVDGYGGKIYLCEPTLAARESVADTVMKETGAHFIPPYDHPHIIAGQGTAGLELMEDAGDLDAVMAPVGGGGLLGGVTIAATSLRPGVRVFAAEPAGADDAARSKAAGRLIPQTAPNTIADGLLTSLGERNWPIIRDLVEQVITVSDDEIIAAMRLVYERMKLVIEPSAATTVAAVLGRSFQELEGMRRVGVILSGGNASLDALPW
jgi:threonine dehydratase/serine racemase